MSNLTAFIIGSGANVGLNTAAALKGQGYRVALGSRNPAKFDQKTKDTYLLVEVDGHSPESIKAAFARVKTELGPPNVVIFNVASNSQPPDLKDPLTLSLEALAKDAHMGLAVWAAAQEAVVSFRSDVHRGVPKTFITTGNPLPWVPANLPQYMGSNISKLIGWRLTECLVASETTYKEEQIRFYFATLVGATGGILENLPDFFASGPQHAKVYLDLITRADQTDWDYRFTLDGQKWVKE